MARLILLIFITLTSFSATASTKDLGPTRKLFVVDGIKVKGTKKVEPEAIFGKISAKKGKALTNYSLRKDIKRIYELKFFESVEARKVVIKGKNILVFTVKEKPIIKEIILDGNDEMDDDDLLEQMKSKEFSILDVNTVKNDVRALQKHYEEKGYYLASAGYRVKKIDSENIQLIFEIKEFQKVKVKNITFLGNRSFSDGELKNIMETREESLFSWMTSAGNFKEFNFQTDIERLKFFYRTKGHLQVFVGNPEVTVSEDKKWVFVTISVNEGPKFTINDITLDGEVLFEEEELLDKLLIRKDETYSEQNLRQDIQMLTEMYQDKGYAFANVLRTLHPVPGDNRVDIQFSFEKGKKAYFGKIFVKGNTKTRDKVVRRELKIHEGMLFSGSKLRESKENVSRLGFFEPGSVVFNTVSPKGNDDTLDVEISVKERNTGQITLGAGYSTATKGFVQASIKQNNFRGLGQVLSFTLNLSSTTQTYNIGFTEPYLFDTKWTAGGDVFSNKDSRSSAYDLSKKGFDIRVGYPVFDYARLFVTYKLEDTELSNVTDPRIDVQLENGVASSIDATLIHDRRNNKFEPSKGHYESASVEFVGVGGAKKWIKTDLEARYYKRVWKDLVFRSRFQLVKLTETDDDRDIPRTEKLFLGGSRNLRGFQYEAIGPKSTYVDPVTNVEIPFNVRGLFSVLGTMELEHPLVREAGLKWVVFADAGNIFEKYWGEKGNDGTNDYSLRYDYGFGFRWFSPIGVLRFEWGFPIAKKIGEDKQFFFDIGQLF